MPVPIEGPQLTVDNGDGKRRKIQSTIQTEKHIPVAVAFKVISRLDKYDTPVKIHFGENCLDEFVESLLKLYDHLQPVLKPTKPLIRPAADILAVMDAAPNCHICSRPLDHSDKHLDHDHLTGNFL